MPCLQALALVIGPVRALARFIAVSRLAAPAANPEPWFRKIVFLSAAPTDASPEARPVFSDGLGLSARLVSGRLYVVVKSSRGRTAPRPPGRLAHGLGPWRP